MTGRLKGALFDLDDTLIDWSGVKLGWTEIEALRVRRVSNFLNRGQRRRVPDTTGLVELYLERTREAWSDARTSLRAPHMPNILMNALAELGIESGDLTAADVIRAYDWSAVPGTTVFPDALPALHALRAQGIKLGIVTNAPKPMSMRDVELDALGLIEFFPDCRLSAADIGYLKPHPVIFERALERLGASPEETVFVGDHPVADIKGALDAGMRAVRRLNGGELDHGNRSASHVCLRSLDELPAILTQWYPDWQACGA